MSLVAGASVTLLCPDALVRGELDLDFSAHPGAGPGPVVELRLEPPPAASARGPWRWGDCRFADAGALRRLGYPGAAAVYDFARERGTVWSADRDLLRELGYLFAHSRLGWALDRAGLHRVHALGVEREGRAGLVVLPSGGGKTALALELARRPGWRLLGDDHPLLDARRGEVRAFHGRPGLRGAPPAWASAADLAVFRRRRHGAKTLLRLSALDGRLAERGRLCWIAFGEGGPAALAPLGAAAAAARLALPLVVGVGLPQVFELLWPGLRASAWGELAAVAARRARAAARASRLARGWRLGLGPAPAAAADLVEEADRRSRP